jgi:hypothetical protein
MLPAGGAEEGASVTGGRVKRIKKYKHEGAIVPRHAKTAHLQGVEISDYYVV